MEASRLFHGVSCLTDEVPTSLKLNHTEKLEQVRDVAMKVEVASLESLQVVDTIKRLGLCYLFQDEIHAILHHHFLAADTSRSRSHSHHLYEASLRFRLLRQHGYCVNSDDFFGKFELNFNGDDDLNGVMEMYEASHLNMGGEEILHEAAIFTSRYLSNSHSKMAKHCLLYPQHKTLPRFTAKFYLDLFCGDDSKPWESLLQELAEFEFANIQSLHKHEILQVVEWWKGLRLGKEEKSWRNEPMKWHMWSIAILDNPRWSKHRILLTKPVSLVYAVDDIFDDISATIHDLTHFTEAVTRWDLCATEELPSYMNTCFNAIYDTTNEISSVVCQEYGWNPIQFLKEEWGSLMDAFLMEAKWFRSSGEMGIINAEEYLKNGVISSGVPMVLSHLYFLLGNPLTNQTHVLLNDPNGLAHSVAKLLRLLDDLAAVHEDEQEEGYDGSYVEMCVKEGKVESLEGGREHVMEMVLKTWEKINEHGLIWTSSSPSSRCFRQACLNAARMVPTMYTYDLNHATLLHHYVQSMFQDQTFAKSILG